MKTIFNILFCIILSQQAYAQNKSDTLGRFETYFGTGYKSSLGYLNLKLGYSPLIFNKQAQFTLGVGATVFQLKTSLGINVLLANKKDKAVIPHIGGDYALGLGGKVSTDSGATIFLLTNQYICPYAGLKFRLRKKDEFYGYMNVQVGYNFLLSPYPNVHFSDPKKINQSTVDYLHGYMQRKIGGGVIIMISASFGINY